MSSIFSQIVNNEIPSFKVAEDENYLAFLDAFPLSFGHVLVIPKRETDYIFDLDSDKYLGLWNFSQKVAKSMDKSYKRKVIRGGSWKDVAYFIENGARTYEYQDTSKCYVGFRTVQSYIGRSNKDRK